jgi:RNA polymerase-associated protein
MALSANRRSAMLLYCDVNDPASHAVRFVLAEKAINVEIKHVNADERPEDLVDLNPYADSVLTLIDRELILYEPQIIMEYLNERFPHPALMPDNSVARASNRLYRYRIQRDVFDYVPSLEKGGAQVESARKAVRDNLTGIAPIFAQRKFFMSDDYSLVDIFLAPVLWRLGHYKIKLPASAKPLLQFGKRMFARDAFEASLSEGEREMRDR